MITAQQMMLDGSAEQMPQKDETTAFLEVSAAEGGLMTAAQAAIVLGVCRQSVMQSIERGKLRSWQFFGRPMVSNVDVVARLKGPREKGGRPRKEAVAA